MECWMPPEFMPSCICFLQECQVRSRREVTQGHFAAFLAEALPGLSNEELVQSCGLFAGSAVALGLGCLGLPTESCRVHCVFACGGCCRQGGRAIAVYSCQVGEHLRAWLDALLIALSLSLSLFSLSLYIYTYRERCRCVTNKLMLVRLPETSKPMASCKVVEAGATQYQDRFFRAAEQRLLSQAVSERLGSLGLWGLLLPEWLRALSSPDHQTP